MNRKFKLIGLLLMTILVLSGCRLLTKEDPPHTTAIDVVESLDIQPLMIWHGERGVFWQEGVMTHMHLEALETYFQFYSAYDQTEELISLVHNNTKIKLSLSQGVLKDERGNDWGSYLLEGNQVAIDPEVFMRQLGYQVLVSERVVWVFGQEALSAFQATVSGSIKEYTTVKKEKNVSDALYYIVDDNPGDGLVIDDEGNLFIIDSEDTVITPSEQEVALPLQVNPPLILAWDLLGNRSDQIVHSSIDAVIPKWLELQKGDGTINNLYRPQYHQNVLSQGAELWVLVNNSFDPAMTSELLNSYTAHMFFVDQMIAYVLKNNITGVNLDFENMYLRDSDLYVQLSAELAVALKAHNIGFSIAVTVPGGSENWSLVYDRERLVEVCDYLTLMAYDQFWASSPVAGPVAGYEWVKQNIEGLLKSIPKHKLVLGVPFYTRVWYETPSTEIPNRMRVRSRSIYMSAVPRLIELHTPTRVWDDVNQQYYFAYFDANQLVKFWYDDEYAVLRKMLLAQEYGLAGVAAWAIGFERQEIWPLVEQFKEGSYE